MTFYLWFMDLFGYGRHNDLSWEIAHALLPRFTGENYNDWLVQIRNPN
jgi:hypothetical protein